MWQSFKNIFHLFQAITAQIYYGNPAKDLYVIGVTGTDGKTTTSNLLYHLLKSANKQALLISTLSAKINGEDFDTGFHTTTPNAFQLQSYLKKAKEEDVEIAIIEVTSHAIDQMRIYGIHFNIVVLTNVSREHLDYHQTFEKYTDVKIKLLKMADLAVVNRDDSSYQRVSQQIKKEKTITYGFDKSASISPRTLNFKTSLIGKFNEYNILAAIAVCRKLGLKDQQIEKGIETFPVLTGRQEVVYKNDFTVMIDFAHTPNGIKQILQGVRETMKKNGKIIHVFGSAGKRDLGKRPEMGASSSELADIIVLTAEDPRGESVNNIIEDIAMGIESSKFIVRSFRQIQNTNSQKLLFKIPDRKEAIETAIQIAKKGDVIIITGKGHEASMNLDGKHEVPWSDHDTVKKVLSSGITNS